MQAGVNSAAITPWNWRGTPSKQPYPFPDIRDPLARVFDAWGFDRCLWGTDWTRAAVVVTTSRA
jgi:L-fuconolactonase